MCVCVCVYPGYVQSPGWDGRTLIYLQNLVGKRVTVKVPLQHKVMFSFKDVHMKGTATNWCRCQPSGVRVGPRDLWVGNSIEACELISLTPVLRDLDELVVLVFMSSFNLPDECRISRTGESVHMSCSIMFHLPMIGTGIMCRKIES